MISLPGVKLTTVEFADGLSFVAVQQTGPVLYTVIILVVLTIATIFWMNGGQVMAILAVIGGGLSLAKSIVVGPKTTLTVNQREVHADGNLPKLLTDEVRIQTSEIKRIGWSYGGENLPSGLYVRHGALSNTCVLPGISQKQAVEIRDAIAGKFPNFPLGDGSDSLLSSGFNLNIG